MLAFQPIGSVFGLALFFARHSAPMQSLVAATSNEWSRMRFMVMFSNSVCSLYYTLLMKANTSTLKSRTSLSGVFQEPESFFRLLKQSFLSFFILIEGISFSLKPTHDFDITAFLHLKIPVYVFSAKSYTCESGSLAKNNPR